MGLNVTKPVFGVSDKMRLKPVSSATETNKKIEFSVVANLDMIMILSKTQITKGLISLCRCAGWSGRSALLLFTNLKHRFSCIEAHTTMNYGKCSKISTLTSFCSQVKYWLSGLEFTKFMSITNFMLS